MKQKLILACMIFCTMQTIFSPSGDEVYKIFIGDNGDFYIEGRHVSNPYSLTTYQTVGFTFTAEETNGRVTEYIKQGKKHYAYKYGEQTEHFVTDKRIDDEIITTYTFPEGTLRTVLKELGLYDEEKLKQGVTLYLSNIFMIKTRKSAKEDFEYESARIYFDMADIIAAKPWGAETKQKLQHYYDMKITVKLEDFVEAGNKGDDDTEEAGSIDETPAYIKDIGAPEAAMVIGADERDNEAFDVQIGIPVNEDVYVNVLAKEALIKLKTIKRSGTKSYSVNVKKSYNITWLEKVEVEDDEEDGYGDDGDKDDDSDDEKKSDKKKYKYIRQYDTVTVSSTEVLARSYSYYEIERFDYYIIDNAQIRSNIFPDGKVQISPSDEYNRKHNATVRHSESIADHIIEPSVNINIYGGTIDGGYSRPTVSKARKSEVDSRFGRIRVKNDYLNIAGSIILDDKYYYESTPEQYADLSDFEQTINRDVLYSSDITIPVDVQNGLYAADGIIEYKKTSQINSGSNEKISFTIESGAPVKVHTPVVCTPLFFENNTEYIQLVNPEDAYHIVLSEDIESADFSVAISNYGKHLDIKGYGERNYKRSTKVNQLRFPFDVCRTDNEEIIKSGTWIDFGEEKQSFYVPLWVTEGTYFVDYRSIALNMADYDDEHPEAQLTANLDSNYYAASGKIKLQISGSFYNLNLYDDDEELEYGAIRKLGETTMFSFETIGSFYDINSAVSLTPKFYYVNADGSSRIAADIYYIDDNDSTDRTLIRIGSAADAKRLKIYNAENNGFNIPEADKKLTASILGIDYDSFRTQKRALFYFGGIRIPWILKTYVNYDYYNALTETKKQYLYGSSIAPGDIFKIKQRWYGEYFLPEKCIVVQKNKNVFDEASHLQGGYIIVNFEITAKSERENYMLDYINEKNHMELGHCSMWSDDIIDNMVLSERGNLFELYPGDLLIYDTTNLLQQEYTREVTH